MSIISNVKKIRKKLIIAHIELNTDKEKITNRNETNVSNVTKMITPDIFEKIQKMSPNISSKIMTHDIRKSTRNIEEVNILRDYLKFLI